VRNDAAEVGPARSVLDEDEHVLALEEHGVDAEEITGENGFGLGGQELRPAGS
jgi:hypothetical protein